MVSLIRRCYHIRITTLILALCLITTLSTSMFLVYNFTRTECTFNPGHKLKYKSPHTLAVLVPFRDRFDELLEFVPHISQFLHKQRVNHHVFVLNQFDALRFNRASLINAGFRFVQNHFDYIAMHDVDLLPLNDNLNYAYPESGPFHVSAPTLHPRYHYKTFIGGILLINREHFVQVNGMSNNYWGWGLEDDEFYLRLRDSQLMVARPQNIKTGTSDTFRHIHDKARRKRDMAKCYNQKEITRRRDRLTGLNNVAYQIRSVRNVTIDGYDLTVLNIELKCDRTKTPWCDCYKSEKPVSDKKVT